MAVPVAKLKPRLHPQRRLADRLDQNELGASKLHKRLRIRE